MTPSNQENIKHVENSKPLSNFSIEHILQNAGKNKSNSTSKICENNSKNFSDLEINFQIRPSVVNDCLNPRLHLNSGIQFGNFNECASVLNRLYDSSFYSNAESIFINSNLYKTAIGVEDFKLLNADFSSVSQSSFIANSYNFKHHPHTSISPPAQSDTNTPEPESSESEPLEWLRCTRYRPPKLSRVKRTGPARPRQLGRHPRIPFSSHQVATLETHFRASPYLSSEDVTKLSKLLDLADIRVKIWFQNRRARERRERNEKSETISNPEDSRISFSTNQLTNSNNISFESQIPNR